MIGITEGFRILTILDRAMGALLFFESDLVDALSIPLGSRATLEALLFNQKAINFCSTSLYKVRGGAT